MEHRDQHFIGSWGEFGPSLEDVVVLTSLLLFSEAHAITLTLDGEGQKRLDFLNKSISDSKYATNKATDFSCAKFFEEGEGRKSQY